MAMVRCKLPGPLTSTGNFCSSEITCCSNSRAAPGVTPKPLLKCDQARRRPAGSWLLRFSLAQIFGQAILQVAVSRSLHRLRTEFPRPYVKWSIEPARAEDVPLAVAQAYEIATQHPRGPVFVSIPSEDWNVLTTLPNNAQSVSGAIPNPDALAELAAKMQRAKNLALVVGSSIDRDGAFDLAVQLAERSGATVWEAPVSSRANFPEDHPRFAGFLPAIPDSLSEKLKPYDLIVVIGAPVFTFHVPGEASLFASGVPIYQITQDPAEASHSWSATSLFGSMNLSIKALLDLLPKDIKPAPARPAREPAAEVQGSTPISIDYAIQSLARARPDDASLSDATYLLVHCYSPNGVRGCPCGK
jgi:benzoylformate decarboxylase